MDEDLRRHLTDMLTKLRPLAEIAERDGVPGRAAAHLRAATFEIEDTLDPEAAERRDAVGRENMEAHRPAGARGRPVGYRRGVVGIMTRRRVLRSAGSSRILADLSCLSDRRYHLA